MNCQDTTNRRPKQGFTLLEVLMAVTIFSLVATSLYTTFRVGLRAYDFGEREMRRMQKGRIIFETMSRDLRSVYFRSETEYNTNIRRMLVEFNRQMREAEMQGTLDEFLYGDEDDPADEGISSPYQMGLEIDLNFTAEEGEEFDSMTFVRYQYDDGVTNIQPWSLGRVSYVVEDDTLVRTEEDIIEPMKDLEGNEIEEKVPRRDVLAKGVHKFDLYFGFFHKDDWMEAENWDANSKQYRNPAFHLQEEYEEYRDDPDFQQDPEFQEQMRKDQMKPPDGLPAFVRVVLEVADEKQTFGNKEKGKKKDRNKKVKTRTFSTLIRIPTSSENYMSSLNEEEEDEEW